jgi:pimeloyl-ACP methyl ester carboxylesterase
VSRDVVLAPGLWMPGIVLVVVSARLAARGYVAHRFTYRGRESFDANVERFAAFVRERLGERPAHFAGHSLGGVLIFDALNRHRDIKVASVVLLGAPVRGCAAGRRFGASPFGRWMLGGCATRWAARGARWQRPEPLGVVAGTVPFGLGRMLGALPGDNDGVVRVEETSVEGMKARVLVALGHSMLVVSGRVVALMDRFFAQGRFD